jgi:putative ABC transport system ATP-binding protein
MTDTLGLPDTKAPLAPSVPAAGSREAAETSAPSAPAAAPVQVEKGHGEGLEPTLYRFISRHSLKRQLLVLGFTLISFPFYYYSLDLPKTIVNRAIGGKKFPQDYLGFEFDQIPYLLVLCAVFLALVFINGGFKYFINVLKGQLGERLLRRLRYELYFRVLRFPIGHFKKVSPAEMIPMITAEVESLGGFMGDAIVQPVFQGGQLVVLIGFMFIQDWALGIAAIALYPIQGYFMPKLRRKVSALGKQRVRLIRQVAERVGETASGIAEIHSNDTARWQLANFTGQLGKIYDVRFEIFRRKFFVKFLNNFINQLTPFFFFSIGGYLVIQGSLSFGALVAVLAAYKELASPWKELLDFYDQLQDATLKYEQVVEQFQPEGMIDVRQKLDVPPVIAPLRGELTLSNISLVEDDRARILENVSVGIPLSQHVALLGVSSSGKNELALVMARLVPPSGGRVAIGGIDIAGLPSAVLGRRIGYASATPHLFNASLRENLHFGLRTRPPVFDLSEVRDKKRRAALEEARLAGNLSLDVAVDWTDYEAAGVKDEAGLRARTVDVIRLVDLDHDVYGLGLRGRIDPKAEPEIAARILEARTALKQRLAEDGIANLVEPFDVERYNGNASMAENLLFGTPTDATFDVDTMATNPYVLEVLGKVGLTEDLVRMGEQVAETMVELFADLPPDHEFFEQFSFISANDLPAFQAILGRLAKGGRDSLKPEDRTQLLSLPFKLIVARHRLDLLDAAMQARILEARRVFAADIPEELKPKVELFDAARYNAASTLQDNVLFGKIAYGEAEAPKRIPVLVAGVLDELGLRESVIAVGLEFGVGGGGARLSLAQRQKVAVARALLKRPDLLILNEATTALDGQSQSKLLTSVREECAGRGIVWVLHRATLAKLFDRVLVMSGGRIVEQGRYEELEKPGTTLSQLVAAE